MTLQRRLFRLPVALMSIYLLFTSGVTSAHASRISDFQCLSSDLNGHPEDLTAYITATAEASRLFNIAPAIMVAIKRTESGLSLNPLVSNKNENKTTDRGYYQINTEVWLPEINRVGVPFEADQLYGVRENAIVAGWVLRRQLNKRDGDAYEAVGYYHKGSGTKPKDHAIRRVYQDKFIAHLRTLMTRCG